MEMTHPLDTRLLTPITPNLDTRLFTHEPQNHHQPVHAHGGPPRAGAAAGGALQQAPGPGGGRHEGGGGHGGGLTGAFMLFVGGRVGVWVCGGGWLCVGRGVDAMREVAVGALMLFVWVWVWLALCGRVHSFIYSLALCSLPSPVCAMREVALVTVGASQVRVVAVVYAFCVCVGVLFSQTRTKPTNAPTNPPPTIGAVPVPPVAGGPGRRGHPPRALLRPLCRPGAARG